MKLHEVHKNLFKKEKNFVKEKEKPAFRCLRDRILYSSLGKN
jgi:hypothetical protein